MYAAKHLKDTQQELFYKNIIKKLKELIHNKITNKINIYDFINQTRALVSEVSKVDFDLLTEDNIKLLKMLSNHYLDIFIENRLLVKYDDLDTLVAFGFENWITEKGRKNFNQILHHIQEDALNLQLHNGNFEICEKILIRQNELVGIQAAIKEELYGYFSQYLLKMVEKKFLNAAYKFFTNKMQPNLSKNELNVLLYDIFVKAFSFQDIEYLSVIVKKFAINFKDYLLKFSLADNKAVEISVISAVFYLKSKESKEEYLRFLKKNNIHPDSDKDSDYFQEKMKSMTALLMASNKGDLETLELLVKYGADINQSIPFKNNLGEIIYCRTPFSVAFGTGNIEFVELLVYKFGANPLTAMINTKRYLTSSHKDLSNLNVMPSMGGRELSERIGKEKYEQYTSNYYEIIENYFLKNLLEYESHVKETPVKNNISTQGVSSLFLPTYDKQLTVFSDSPSSTAAVASVSSVSPISDSSVKPVTIDEKLFSDYIDFKKITSSRNVQRSSLENEFDILLLEYIQINSEENLKKLHDFISENLEIEFYLVSTILKNVDNTENVQDILINKPDMLHKFFKIKKQYSDLLLNKTGEIIEVIPDGVYKVQSNLKNALYVAISLKVKEKLCYDNPVLLHKFTNQLNCCKFIEANSKGISGIKIIGGIIKLKLANENISIATDVKYVNESSLTTLILFDKIIDHNFKYPNKRIKIEKVNDFDDIFSKLKETECAVSCIQPPKI